MTYQVRNAKFHGDGSDKPDRVWCWSVEVFDGDDFERVDLRITHSAAIQHGHGGEEDEDSTAFIEDYVRRRTFDNYRPALEQVREWKQPLYVLEPAH